MIQLISYLTLALSSLSVLAPPTDISLSDVSPTNILPSDISTIPYTGTLTFNPLHKRALDLPNNWHFILKSQPLLVEPIDVSARAIIPLYTAAIKRASQVSAMQDRAASFRHKIFVITFTGDPEDNKPLAWPTVLEFCTRMKEKAERGLPLLFEGWLVNRETEEQNFVKFGFLEEVDGAP
ncbi:MAG: hypothetical protein L6R36_002860 [Xanthoria steineri]|nr:MAG: hypothetical protein L6R36_002860 [Xanthoria steineri]